MLDSHETMPENENKNTKHKKSACLAVLGTGSDVGKSIVATALCRICTNRGLRVAPFKAQNMSNNSGVTPEGREMGRAQIVQAEAARVAPHTDMNPVLLKPVSDMGSQVVLNGRVWMDAVARDYYAKKDFLLEQSREALDRLRLRHELIVMEGAGSCAEVNLMAHDIVNLRAAAYAEAPVILVADIDRGGVFAQIVGTLACLPPEQQERIKGFVINRFRGDISLFKSGIDWIEERTGKPVFGVLPWFKHFQIESEDAVVIDQSRLRVAQDTDINIKKIAVIRLPHISNFTDFEPLDSLSDCQLVYLQEAQDLNTFTAVILPGTKSTRGDLEWLEQSGWRQRLLDYAATGGHILGICGGYQILGTEVEDLTGAEGPAGTSKGLGLLPVRTVLQADKLTTRTRFTWQGITGQGYEIHMGKTIAPADQALLRIDERNGQATQDQDGCISADGHVIGTYVHGLFDSPDITRHWLHHIGLDDVQVGKTYGPIARDQAYDLLAQHASQHLNIEAILALLPPELRKVQS